MGKPLAGAFLTAGVVTFLAAGLASSSSSLLSSSDEDSAAAGAAEIMKQTKILQNCITKGFP